MLRTLFVVVVLAVGWGFALQSPLYAACLYLWIAYFRPESWAWNDLFVTLNLSYIAGAYLVIRTMISGVPLRLGLRGWLLVLFLAQALVATLLGPDSAYSFGYLRDFAKVIVVSLLLTAIIRTSQDLRLVLIVIAVSLGFEAVKQGWTQMLLNPGARNGNSIPFLGDNNVVAVGMAMLIPIIAALAETSTGWRKRAWQFANIGVFYRGLSTYSRGGFLAVGAVGAVQLWRSPHRVKTLAAIAVVTLLVLPVLPQQFWDRMSTITAPEDRDSSTEGRLHFWQVAVAMANDHPLTGVGHSAYPRAYNQYDWTAGEFGLNRAVHSAWFGVLAELGYPGLLLFGAIVLSSLRACRRVRRAARRGEVPAAMGPYAVALESSLVAFIIGGSFVSFHYSEMLWHYFGLSIALERVAAHEMAAERERLEQQQRDALAAQRPDAEPVQDFVWA
ncbi:MAG: putative O-glycosylation ligase, exosortase A system-associated [Cyanobacteria bacterium]|nr:putative O-glycosylation ligase, exosortase A system-associated [Cyanobacteriota bacterium]